MKIYAPVKDSNGIWATVRFVNGVGETDNPKLIEWFRNHGYRLEGEEKFIEINAFPEKEKDLKDMTPNELREYAKANGFGREIKNTRDRAKLLEIIRGDSDD